MRDSSDNFAADGQRWDLLAIDQAAAAAGLDKVAFVTEMAKGRMPRPCREFHRDDAGRKWIRRPLWRRGDIMRAALNEAQRRCQISGSASPPPPKKRARRANGRLTRDGVI